MTSKKTKVAAWFVWVSTWTFAASVIFGIASIFFPTARVANWGLIGLVSVVLIFIGVKSHMGNIMPEAINQGKDAFEIANTQEERIK